MSLPIRKLNVRKLSDFEDSNLRKIKGLMMKNSEEKFSMKLKLLFQTWMISRTKC